MSRQRVLMPLPRYGFDPTEVGIPWKILTSHNIDVVFATPDGQPGMTDSKMLTGEHLGLWTRLLQARQDAVEAYREMEQSRAFHTPIHYSAMKETDCEGLLLSGGHDKGVKEYLESETLQQCVVEFFTAAKPVAAICHGVIVAARSINPLTNKSVIHSYQTTALLRTQELTAYNLTRLWLGDYYLTYPGLTVEDEVRACLSDPNHFHIGRQPLFRDDMKHLHRGFTVRDRNYLSARWPGDAYSFSLAFVKMLQDTMPQESAPSHPEA
jgi:putative intracellular protease/amidase